jgi:outer membrane biogenesis lipoprotein LolB
MPPRRAARAVLPALAALAVACTPRVPPPDLSLDPAALLQQVRAASGIVARVQGEARLRVDAPGQKGSATAFVAVERPDRLHVEVLDFFGNPAAVLVAGDGRLAIDDRRSRTFYRGEATAENVARLVPLPLPPERIVALLLGAPPLEGAPASAEPGRGFVTLRLADPPRSTELRVGPRAAVERATWRGEPGLPDHDVVYRSFVDLLGGRFPEEVAISAPAAGVRVELAWKEPDLTSPIGAAMFRLEPPAGARVVDLDGAGGPLPPLPLAPPPP